MKSQRIFRFLSGSLTLCADGPFTERLINICMHRGMPVWDIRRCGNNRVTFKTDITSFKQIRVPAKRTKSHIKIVRRHGLPFILNKYSHRYFTIIGVVVLTTMLWYASTHVMGITVFGNTRLDTQIILDSLGECGLSLGTKTSDIDNNSIRNQMVSKFDNLAWVGINSSGSRVYIEIVERIEKESGVDKEGVACNIVASKDGEIEKIEVREGQTLTKIGSGVRKGDVLVSGIVNNSANGFRYVQARGEVYAKTRYSITRSYPLNYTENIPTGKIKRRYTLSVLNYKLPLYIKKNSPFKIYSYSDNINEYRIPVDILPSLFIQREEFVEEITENKSRTPAQALETGISDLSDELKSEIGENINILEQNVSHTLTEHGEIEVTVEFICSENIAEPSVIEKTIPETEQ